MVQILNRADNSGDWGKSIASALQQLAHHKIQKNATEHKLRFLKGSGLSHEQALHGAHLPEEHFGHLLKGIQNFRTGMEPKKSPIESEEDKLRLKSRIQEENNKKIQIHKAKKDLETLNKMEQLAKHGRLSGGTWSNFAGKIGSSAVLTTPDTEVFNKLSAQLLPEDATEEQLKTAQRKIPNTGQSSEAKLRNIKDLKENALRIINGEEFKMEDNVPENYSFAGADLEVGSIAREEKTGNERIYTPDGWRDYDAKTASFFDQGQWIPISQLGS